VIFSIFGRKGGRTPERKRSAGPDTVPPRTGPSTRPAPTRTLDPREIARQTAAKIDEIESEMIAPAGPRPAVGTARVAPSQVGLAGNVYVPSGIGAGAAFVPPPVAPPPAAGATREAPPTVPALTFPGPAAVPRLALGGEADTSVILGDGSSDGMSMEVGGSALPPAFEEAAVLYSNGQEQAAATILVQASQEMAGPHAKQAWAMLFDLYQATGRQQEFESTAIDYSARFETSPPTWDATIAPPRDTPRAAAGAPATVALPAMLDAQAVRQLEQVQRHAQRSRGVQLDASAVRGVDPIGADLLLRVLSAFARSKHELVVAGADSLLGVLAGVTEPGRRDPSESCWLLQLELLRLLGRQQTFDDLAIDYCVTYEVSPPAWEPMPASIRAAEGGAEALPQRAAGEACFRVDTDAFALSGELSGRAQDALAALRAYAADRAEVVVDCRRLRRLDFAAAGELLNEVVALRTGGKYLVFRDTNHLVAALLAVMGIPDLAEIRLRRL
jgi:anti-anti-sigma regulatory factor